MKLRKQTILVMLFGLLLLAFTAVVAQTPAQGDQKKAESCCAMDSCPMKTDGAEAKSDCCKADSCDMKDKKHDMKDHTADCCKAKAKDKTKN